MGREAHLEAWSKTSFLKEVSCFIREFEDLIEAYYVYFYLYIIYIYIYVFSFQVQPSLLTYLEESFTESYTLGPKWV